MSKIGKKPIIIPEGVEAKLEKDRLEIKGPKGVLALDLAKEIRVDFSGNQLSVSQSEEKRESRAVWGLTRALINNMVTGVSEGYEKKLELRGVGYRMNISEKKIVMALGFSHPVEVKVPEGLEVKIEENNILSIKGINKQIVGQFAADVRALKKVEPYKGKGFRYVDEKVRKKVGKKAGTVK